MTKMLAILLWPAGIAVIFGAGALLARRAPRTGGRAGCPPGGHRPAAGRDGAAAGARNWEYAPGGH